MSDFSIRAEQRARLLEGSNAPLEFDIKPSGCEVGAVYVLASQRATVAVCKDDGFVTRTPARPTWFITVTKLKRAWKPAADPPRMVWTVSFEMTDRRDTDLWLSHSGNYQTSPRGAVDELPVAPSDEVRRKARAEFAHLRKLQEHTRSVRNRNRERRQRAA